MTSFILISPSPLLAYSPLASPARLPLTLPVGIAAAANTANNLFTHIYHCFTVTCFNGGFVSSFECRWGYVRAAFGAAGPGGRGVADRWAAEEAGPAEGAESNTGNIPGWRLQVWGKYAACCYSHHLYSMCFSAQYTRSSQMSFTLAPGNHRHWVQQRKTRSRPRAMTSPPLPPPVFEISTHNRLSDNISGTLRSI